MQINKNNGLLGERHFSTQRVLGISLQALYVCVVGGGKRSTKIQTNTEKL